MAFLVSLCEGRVPNPMPKVVKNLCAMLSTASDAAKLIAGDSNNTSFTNTASSAASVAAGDEAPRCTATSGVLTLDRQQVSVVACQSVDGLETIIANMCLLLVLLRHFFILSQNYIFVHAIVYAENICRLNRM